MTAPARESANPGGPLPTQKPGGSTRPPNKPPPPPPPPPTPKKSADAAARRAARLREVLAAAGTPSREQRERLAQLLGSASTRTAA